MKRISGNEPASPVTADLLKLDNMGHLNNAGSLSPFGLTIRHHFAGLAMQGYITAGDKRPHGSLALDAVLAADALIYELNLDRNV